MEVAGGRGWMKVAGDWKLEMTGDWTQPETGTE